jgi:hypothetical protein
MSKTIEPYFPNVGKQYITAKRSQIPINIILNMSTVCKHMSFHFYHPIQLMDYYTT